MIKSSMEQHTLTLCTRNVKHCSTQMILMQMETVFNPKVGLS